MKAQSIVKQGNKSKNFTFRITSELSDRLAEVQAKCRAAGVRVNLTAALTVALEKEVKALQLYVQKEVDPTWAPGQKSLDFDGADAHTK